MSNRTQVDRELDWSTGRELERRDAKIALMVIALNEARADLYDAWHSHMSQAKFEADPTIRAIDAALASE